MVRRIDPGAAVMPPTPRPAALDVFPPERVVHLDVRDDIRRGAEPFARIMAAVTALAPDQALVVRAPFEPVPLYTALGRRGLAHWTEWRAGDDWLVWFYRDTDTGPRREVTLDVRGLAPPGPMVRVLEVADRLGGGEVLLVQHDRRPMFLYPELDARGFAHDTREVAPGLVEIRIRRLDGVDARLPR